MEVKEHEGGVNKIFLLFIIIFYLRGNYHLTHEENTGHYFNFESKTSTIISATQL